MTHLKTKRLATYRNALLRTFSLLTFLAFTTLISLPEVSKAQCPDGTWTYDQTQVIIPNTTCVVTVYYCWKYDDATHTLNEIIETIVPNSDNACNSLSAPAILQAVVTNFETTPPFPA